MADQQSYGYQNQLLDISQVVQSKQIVTFEAFALGLLASFAETPFVVVLMLVSADSLLKLPLLLQIGMFLGYYIY